MKLSYTIPFMILIGCGSTTFSVVRLEHGWEIADIVCSSKKSQSFFFKGCEDEAFSVCPDGWADGNYLPKNNGFELKVRCLPYRNAEFKQISDSDGNQAYVVESSYIGELYARAGDLCRNKGYQILYSSKSLVSDTERNTLASVGNALTVAGAQMNHGSVVIEQPNFLKSNNSIIIKCNSQNQ